MWSHKNCNGSPIKVDPRLKSVVIYKYNDTLVSFEAAATQLVESLKVGITGFAIK